MFDCGGLLIFVATPTFCVTSVEGVVLERGNIPDRAFVSLLVVFGVDGDSVLIRVLLAPDRGVTLPFSKGVEGPSLAGESIFACASCLEDAAGEDVADPASLGVRGLLDVRN